MSSGARNIQFGLVALPVGILGGLCMALYAFVPMVKPPLALAHYDSLPRRLLRLSHVAAIMLPLMNVVLGMFLDRIRLSRTLKESASWLLILGAAGLPLSLLVEAFSLPAAQVHVSTVPALALTGGICLVSYGALRSPRAAFIVSAPQTSSSSSSESLL